MTVRSARALATLRIIACAFVAALAYGCKTDPTKPQVVRGIHVVIGGGQTGSPGTVLHDALVVELRDSTGAIVQGSSVRFAAVQPAGGQGATVTLSNMGLMNFASTSFDITSTYGLAGAFVKLGDVPGTARIEITAPELGVTDTVSFVIR